MKHPFLTLLILIFGSVISFGQTLENQKQIDDYIQSQIKAKEISGAVVMVTQHQKTILHQSYGLQDVEDKIKMDTASIFRIYSMTKPITSLAAMILVDRGEINLDDNIVKYFPEFKDIKVLQNKKMVRLKNKITVRDLLRHTSGFGYGYSLGDDPVDKMYNKNHPLSVATFEQMINRLATYPLNSQPGTKYKYSLSVDVLGCLISRVSKMSLGEFFKANLFKSLNMNDTDFMLSESKVERFCSYYEKNLKLKESYKKSTYRNKHMESGGGGLISTSADYMKFCHLILNEGIVNGDTIISPYLIAEMSKNQLPEGEAIYKNKNGVGIGFGLGFSVYMKEWGKHGHPGDLSWSGIGSTHFYISPKEDLAIVIMSQHAPFSDKLLSKLKPLILDGIVKNLK